MYVQLNFLCLYITHTYRALTNIGNATVKSDVKLVFVSECIILFVSLSHCWFQLWLSSVKWTSQTFCDTFWSFLTFEPEGLSGWKFHQTLIWIFYKNLLHIRSRLYFMANFLSSFHNPLLILETTVAHIVLLMIFKAQTMWQSTYYYTQKEIPVHYKARV